MNAFISPPTDSIASAISRALRVSVPLNSRCSRKWLAPHSSVVDSSRAPLPTHAPIVTDRSSGNGSVTTRRPESSRVRLITVRHGAAQGDADRGPGRRDPATAAAAAPRSPPRSPRHPPAAGRAPRPVRGRRTAPWPGLPRTLRTTPVSRTRSPTVATRAARGGSAPTLGRSLGSPPPPPDRTGSSPPSPRPPATAKACRSGRCRRRARVSSSPNDNTSSTRSMRLPRPSFEMWTRPSRPGRMLTNAPNFVMFTTRPS